MRLLRPRRQARLTMPPARIRLNRPSRQGRHKPSSWSRSREHLSFVRCLPCMKCGRVPCDAAHVRNGTDGAMGRRPSDSYAVPLCKGEGCHAYQHLVGEETFWAELGDPLSVACRLWQISGDLTQGHRAVERFRQRLPA